MRLRTALFELQLAEESNRAQKLCMEGVHLTAPILHSFNAETHAYNKVLFGIARRCFLFSSVNYVKSVWMQHSSLSGFA